MLGAAVIVFRETLEAALLIGIIAAATRTIAGRARWIVGGILAGAVGATLVAFSAGPIAGLFDGMGQEVFNAVVLALAIAMLAWHQIWMSSHSRELVVGAKKIAIDVSEGRLELTAVFVVIALAVLREGAESVLFLYGMVSGGGTTGAALLTGAIAGVAAGASLGGALYAGMLRIPLRWFFSATSALILLLAAGMASKLAQLLIQADILPGLTSPLWDTSFILPADSAIGVFMHALLGYDPHPATTQVLIYAATIVLILLGMWLKRRPSPSPKRK